MVFSNSDLWQCTKLHQNLAVTGGNLSLLESNYTTFLSQLFTTWSSLLDQGAMLGNFNKTVSNSPIQIFVQF